jgi:hypothetical protein
MRNELNELLKRDPFVPFTLVMNSGDRYGVDYPNLAVLGDTLFYVMRVRSDRQDILRLTEISSVEIAERTV